MIEPSPKNDALYDRLMSLKPEGLSTRAWTINAGVGSGFFDAVAAGATPREGELPKVLAVVGITLAEFEGRRRKPSASAPSAPPALRVLPRGAKAPSPTPADPSAQAASADTAPARLGSAEAGEPDSREEPADAAPGYAAATAEAIARWLEARRQADAAGLDTRGSEGVRLVSDLAGLALDLERAPGHRQSSSAG